MKFSLIVSTRGRTQELSRLFRSLGDQTLQDFEVIISDQNEDDRILPVLRKPDWQERLIHVKSSGGASRGRNRGMARASGDILGFPDDDCAYPPYLLEQVAEFFETHPEYGYLTGRSYADDGEASVSRHNKRASPINKMTIHRQGIEFTLFVRRSQLREIRFDEFMGVGALTPWHSDEGPDLMLRLQETGVQGYYDPRFATWHAHPIKSYNAKEVDRTYRYACGNGYFYRKHRYPFWFFAYQMARTACGLLLALLTLRLGMARLHLARIQGRWRGWSNSRDEGESFSQPHMIKLLGNSYLTGRKLNLVSFLFLAARDTLLRPFMTARPAPPPDMKEVRQIGVAKPDYLGDLLMVTPTLEILRTTAPQAKITLVVGKWTRTLAEFLQSNGLVDDIIIFNLALLDRSKDSVFKKFLAEFRNRGSAISLLRKKELDLFLDLRPFSPNSWSIGFYSGAKYRAGFGLRGMSFTYHRLIAFDDRKSMGQLFLDEVCAARSEKVEYLRPCLPSTIHQVRKVLPEKMDRPYLAVQLYSGEDQRNVPRDCWIKIMESALLHYSIVLVGSKADEGKATRDNLLVPGLLSLLGKTTIPELCRVVEESHGVISVDSFSAHIGLAYKKRVAVLAVEGISDRRSYPQDNPDLRFFSCPPVTYAEIEAFLQSSPTVTKAATN